MTTQELFGKINGNLDDIKSTLIKFANELPPIEKIEDFGYLEIVKRAIAETDYVREKFATFRNSFPL